MQIHYAVALWNYYFYGSRNAHKTPGAAGGGLCLEEVIADVRAAGYGLEMWGRWQGRDLYDPASIDALAPLLRGMNVSVHTDGARNAAEHERQMAAAEAWNAGVLVLHPADLLHAATGALDAPLARDVVARAGEHGVTVALENGRDEDDLERLSEALQQVDGLRICLDTGHIDRTRHGIGDYLDRLGAAIVHLHLEDNLTQEEAMLPGSRKPVHYRPGSGSIPHGDWTSLFEHLDAHGFCGTAVIEIQPRNPLQLAVLTREYLNRMMPANTDPTP